MQKSQCLDLTLVKTVFVSPVGKERLSQTVDIRLQR